MTASGAVWAVLALDAVWRADPRGALIWMLVATLVDGLDGPLARVARVRDGMPMIDGALLDNVVDYLNYVVVPAWLIARAGLLVAGTELVAASAICAASALQFSHVEAKSAAHTFRGFPSYWNVVAFYFLLLRPDPRAATAIVVALAVCALLPLRFVHPARTLRWRAPTLALTALWTATVAWLIWSWPERPGPLVWASLLYPAYYGAVSVGLMLRRRRAA